MAIIGHLSSGLSVRTFLQGTTTPGFCSTYMETDHTTPHHRALTPVDADVDAAKPEQSLGFTQALLLHCVSQPRPCAWLHTASKACCRRL